MSIFSRQDFAVYPRWRGEHTPLLESGECYRGLSPLARGTLFVNCVCHGLQRFIPAGAGNTERRRLAGFARRFIPAGAGNTMHQLNTKVAFPVYPRWRGEHKTQLVLKMIDVGLSPLARGTPCASNHSFGDTRFIPAGAGNTTVTKSVSGRVSVYPRWRGEHESTFINISCTGGLSPLARGTRDYQRGQIIYCRFIPAGAGNTLSIHNCF